MIVVGTKGSNNEHVDQSETVTQPLLAADCSCLFTIALDERLCIICLFGVELKTKMDERSQSVIISEFSKDKSKLIDMKIEKSVSCINRSEY